MWENVGKCGKYILYLGKAINQCNTLLGLMNVRQMKKVE